VPSAMSKRKFHQISYSISRIARLESIRYKAAYNAAWMEHRVGDAIFPRFGDVKSPWHERARGTLDFIAETSFSIGR